jgi:aryl-alcohol dehydrogenase-like predicted oxidoreductase
LPAFGNPYFDPAKVRTDLSGTREQLEGLSRLVKAGKVREIGLSNETAYGVMDFTRVAAEHGLPRIVSVQNPYCLINRSVDNGLDETMYHEQVGLLAYSPLGFGQLTGKYDASGHDGADAPQGGRLQRYESVRKGRWGRAESLAAARRYNGLALQHGLSPTRMALAFCYTNWRVASTILGVTNVAQLDECLDAWGTTLSPQLLAQIDAVRWEIRDPSN